MRKLFIVITMIAVCLPLVVSQDSLKWTDYLERNFENLPAEKQIEIFCTYFADDYGPNPKMGFNAAFGALIDQTTEDVIPYLKYYFIESSLDYDPIVPYGNLRDVTVKNILFLIDYRIGIMNNLDKEIGLWFANIAEHKVKNYITKYKRIGSELAFIEIFIRNIVHRDSVTRFISEEFSSPSIFEDPAFWGKLLYEKYVVSNGFEVLDIGLTEELVFPGYEGRIIYED